MHPSLCSEACREGIIFVKQGDGPDHDNEEEVQAFMDAEEEALNEEERLLMDGPDFDHALQNAYQQGLDANNPDVNIPDVSLADLFAGFASPVHTAAKIARSSAVNFGFPAPPPPPGPRPPL